MSLLKRMEPTVVEIDGSKIPLFFSLRAAAEMEERLEKPYPAILDELFQAHAKDDPVPPAMSWPRQAEVIACLIRAGGIPDVTAVDLMELHVSQANALCQGAIREILYKTQTQNPSKKK